MKVLRQRDFKKEAYNLLLEFQRSECECVRCETVFVPETFLDFKAHVTGPHNYSLDLECPVCSCLYAIGAHFMVVQMIKTEQEKWR